jgi:UPF0716 family protein affecting phage T7 exclusion
MVFLILVIAAIAVFIAVGLSLGYLLTLRNQVIISDPSVLAPFEFDDARS